MSRFFDAIERRQLLCAVASEGHFDPAPASTPAFAPALTVTLAEPVISGTWASGPAMPASLAEVAAGAINGKLYVVGDLDPATFVYDLASNTWATAAARPHPGNHHAAEVINGKLYLFGGFDAGSEGKVQVYDPAGNAWTLGADMPFAAGSSSTALIGGKVYVAGGIVGGGGAGGSTTGRTAVYDPATNAWVELEPMPQGRNHTAAGTDGLKLYVFGGRGPGSGDRNVTTNGFDTFQLYDPATNAWQSSLTPGSPLPPLPQARSGMGKAVYLGGAFYVIGGETLTGAGATDDGVYHRVDVYDPATNAWRRDADLPTARHGIFPVEAGGKVYVAGGGVKFGGSASGVLEVFTPVQVPDPPPPPPPPRPPAPTPAVVGRHVFYNHSAFDGNDPAGNAADDAAVATDKVALLAPAPVSGAPPVFASFANYTSYDKGLNGVMVDVANLPAGVTPAAESFAFEVGNAARSAGAWAPGPAPASVTVRPGAGVNSSTRVTLTWPDGQIQKTWLRVRVVANGTTGLAQDDVFYFGNWPGETGNRTGDSRGKRPADTRVNKADAKLVARNRTRRRPPVTAPPAVTSRYDFNRDGVIDVLDRKVVAQNKSSRRAFLVLIEGA